MKTTETIFYQNTNLTILVEVDEHDKAAIEYFINGYQVTDWSKIKPVFQNLFTVISDEVCRNLKATKWSY